MKRGLGKGLGALLGENDDFLEELEERASVGNRAARAELKAEAEPSELPIDKVFRNEDQPRKAFDQAAMDELANSIRMHGVITPIVVVPKGDGYMIIAGERRWRASKKAGLITIPAIVRKYSVQQIAEISLIENIQREDLNPVEVANSLNQLMKDYDYTQEEVSRRVGKSRSAVANLLGLLSLSDTVVDMVAQNRLSVGHAKILHALPKDAQSQMAYRAVDGKMTVRKFEEMVKAYKAPEEVKKERYEFNIEFSELINDLQKVFATKVTAIGNNNKGRIYIDYYNKDDLDRFVQIAQVLKDKMK